jgi:hypothetical protein
MNQKIINLTGIHITYRDHGEIRTVEPSGIRLVATRRFVDTGRRVGDAVIAYIDHEIPEILNTQFGPKEDTLYLVDPTIAAAMVEHDVRRDDVLVSHGSSAERDSSRQIVASRRFVVANPETLIDN